MLIEKRWRSALSNCLICLGIVLASWASTYSASYQTCQDERRASGDEKSNFRKEIAYFLDCEGVTIDDNGLLISAVATAFIAWFTLSLRRSTDKLWEASESQRKDARKALLVEIAAHRATFAYSKQSLELARSEFNATHRPKIIARNFQFAIDPTIKAGKEIHLCFIGQNIGSSPGKVIEVRSATIILDAGEAIPGDLSFPYVESFSFELASGQRELFPINGGSAPKEGEPFAIFEGMKWLYCLGTLAYVDGGNIRRETGFCRRYVGSERRWVPVESEYEYTY